MRRAFDCDRLRRDMCVVTHERSGTTTARIIARDP